MQEVLPSSVGKTLTLERKSHCADAAGVQTRLANLIIFRDESFSLTGQEELISFLTRSFPSRIFSFDFSDSISGSIQTRVNCRPLTETSCSEEVYISLNSSSKLEIQNFLLSLLVPGHLEKTKSSELRILFEGVSRLVDRVIFDSIELSSKSRKLLENCFASTGEYQSSVGVSCVAESSGLLFRDISWRRLERWRVLVSEQFDSERLREGVEKLKTVKLTGNSKSAFLLAGWFAERLGAIKCSSKKTALSFKGTSASKVVVSVEENDSNLLEKVELGFGDEVLSIVRDSLKDTAMVSSSNYTRQVSFVNPSLESLILGAIVSNSAGRTEKAVSELLK